LLKLLQVLGDLLQTLDAHARSTMFADRISTTIDDFAIMMLGQVAFASFASHPETRSLVREGTRARLRRRHGVEDTTARENGQGMF
jgi:hypothetical protein